MEPLYPRKQSEYNRTYSCRDPGSKIRLHCSSRLYRDVVGYTCFVDCQSISCFIKFTHATCNLQRIGVQLYTDKRNGRDQFWMDTCKRGRVPTGRPHLRTEEA